MRAPSAGSENTSENPSAPKCHIIASTVVAKYVYLELSDWIININNNISFQQTSTENSKGRFIVIYVYKIKYC